MRVAVTGATGVLGRAAVRALLADGHEVSAIVRDPAKTPCVERLGATPLHVDVYDRASLAAAFRGCDAVCSLATRVPVGLRAVRSSAWHENDRLRTEGVRRVVEAARDAHVRRVVQESVSLVYADQGEDWIDELSPLDISAATEPSCVAEAHVQDFANDVRQGVVLRFGVVVGDDAGTRLRVRGARIGRPVGLGRPDGWVHPVHTDDVGPAVAAAVRAPCGIYNVGADPVRRRDLVQGYADAAGRDSAAFMGPFLRRISGERWEPATRSLRVSSRLFHEQTGWRPSRARFDSSWLGSAQPSEALR